MEGKCLGMILRPVWIPRPMINVVLDNEKSYVAVFYFSSNSSSFNNWAWL